MKYMPSDEPWDGKTPLRLLGVALADIDRTGGSQISLFTDGEKERQQKLDKLTDAIRGRFGADALIRAAACDPAINVGKKHKAQLDLHMKKDAKQKRPESEQT